MNTNRNKVTNDKIQKSNLLFTVAEQLSFTSKNPKLTKTQGTNKYQNVHCIIQDKDGNIWLGTTDGRLSI